MSPPHKKTVDNYLIKKISIKIYDIKNIMKTKILKILCALIFAAGISVAQDTYFNVFLGGTDFAPFGTNDISDPSNYYTFSKDGKESTKLWGGQ